MIDDTADLQKLPHPRCTHCGYNVRGVHSDVCPECGKEFHIAIGVFRSSGQFNAVATSLADEGITFLHVQLQEGQQPTDQLLLGTSNFGSAAIFVKRSDYVRAKEIATEIAEHMPRPIVDRSEPNCPRCNALMDPTGSERCAACGMEFQWVEIEEPLVTREGLHCKNCGYELTKCESQVCPECGIEIPPPTVTQLADAAVKDESFMRESEVRWRKSPSYQTIRMTVICFLAFLATTTWIWLDSNRNSKNETLVDVGVCVIILIAGIAYCIFRARKPR